MDLSYAAQAMDGLDDMKYKAFLQEPQTTELIKSEG